MNKIFGLIGLCLLTFTIGLDFLNINLALTTIQNNLLGSFIEMQWVMVIYAIALAGLSTTINRVGTVYGQKKCLISGIIFFGIGVFIAGVSPSTEELLLGRTIQGLGASIILPTTRWLTSTLISSKSRSSSLWLICLTAGMAISPLYAGLILSALSWRWIFFNDLPLILFSLIMVRLCIKETKTSSNHSIDIIKCGLVSIATVALAFFIIQGSSWGWSDSFSLICYCVMIIACGIYYFREHLKTSISKNKQYSLVNFFNFCSAGLSWSYFFLFPMYLQSLHHLNPLEAGFVILAFTMPFFLINFIKAWVIKILGNSYVLPFGLALFGLSTFSQVFFKESTTIFQIVSIGFIQGFGWGLIFNSSLNHSAQSVENQATVGGIGRVACLAIVTTLFRISNQEALQLGLQDSHATISQSQLEQLTSILSDPELLNQQIEQYGAMGRQTLIPLVKNSFLEAYHISMIFISMIALSLSAILFAFHIKNRLGVYQSNFSNRLP